MRYRMVLSESGAGSMLERPAALFLLQEIRDAFDPGAPEVQRLSAAGAQAPGDASGQPRLSLQPGVPALPRECRSDTHGDDGREDARDGARVSAAQAHAQSRYHRR